MKVTDLPFINVNDCQTHNLRQDGRTEAIVEIHPGDLGTRYKLLDGHENGFNRNLLIGHARKMARSWREIQLKTEIHLLWDAKTNTLFILDGQHRIWCASEYLQKNTHLRAIIWDSEDALPGNDTTGAKVPQYIQGMNSTGKLFRWADHLHNYKALSPWPDLLSDVGLDPNYSGGKSLSWPSIIRGYGLAQRSSGRPNGGSINLKVGLDIWLDEPEDKIVASIPAIQWWAEIAAHAQMAHTHRAKRPFTALWMYTFFMLAFLTWEQNDPRILKGRKEQFEIPQTIGFRSLSHSKLDEIAQKYLFIINWRKQTRLVTLFGDSGR